MRRTYAVCICVIFTMILSPLGCQKTHKELKPKIQPNLTKSRNVGLSLKSPLIVSLDEFTEFNRLPKDIANKSVDFIVGNFKPQGYSVDLDSDGVKEWIISVDEGSCGESYNIYQKSKDDLWILTGEPMCFSLKLKIGLSKTNGFYDITGLSYPNNDPMKTFVYDGKKYVNADDSSTVQDNSQQVQQTEIEGDTETNGESVTEGESVPYQNGNEDSQSDKQMQEEQQRINKAEGCNKKRMEYQALYEKCARTRMERCYNNARGNNAAINSCNAFASNYTADCRERYLSEHATRMYCQ